jgi:CheY-like chemotaxis protein
MGIDGDGDREERVPMTEGTATDVLIVDFYDPIRTSSAEILRLAGLSVAEADDGENALELLGKHRFGMVLLALDLPWRTGVEVLDALDDPPPVVILSKHEIPSDDLERIRPKLVGYLRKPVAPRVLIDTIAALLR